MHSEYNVVLESTMVIVWLIRDWFKYEVKVNNPMQMHIL